MTEKEKMLASQLYRSDDPQLVAERMEARRLTALYNQTAETQEEDRRQILRQLFASVGEGVFIEPPFRCDYGRNIHLGNHVYLNFDCIILDVAPVTIGDGCLLAPRVCLTTAGHPTDPATRRSGLEFGKPIVLGDNVWLGAGVIVNPGVTIGENTVVASGAVVTKDLPPNVVAAGCPARVIRYLEPGSSPQAPSSPLPSFRPALPGEEKLVLQLIQARIHWMDQVGIRQWNDEGYLAKYPLPYFAALRQKGQLYVLAEGGRIVGGIALLDQDPRWEDGKPAWYLHHLVGDPEVPGAGRRVMEEVLALAPRMGKQRLRLDSSLGNEALSRFYRRFGFEEGGRVSEGNYQGTLWEKRL